MGDRPLAARSHQHRCRCAPAHPPILFIYLSKMIGKVLQDSFQDLRICIEDEFNYKPSPLSSSSSRSPASSLGESLLSRDCQESIWGSPSSTNFQSPTKSLTEMCRPYQDEGVCKYGDKCQFAHGQEELRSVQRHPKYKTDLCRTYHKKGFCPYGPRCHFIHDLAEYQPAPSPAAAPLTPAKKNEIKQLPMFGGQQSTWSFNHHTNKDMKEAVVSLNNLFYASPNHNRQNSLNSSGSSDSSRSGSFCSDLDSPSSPIITPSSPFNAPPSPAPSVSPTPIGAPRLPIFSRLE